MTDNSSSADPELEGGQAPQLLSESFDRFKEELETLYILANMSGRINFAKNWPVVARRIFGEELIGFDTHGADDLDRRAELEAEAETRRIELLEMLDPVEENSVASGALQVEYVQALVQKLGRPIALNVYSATIVDRFIPPSAEEIAEQASELPQGEAVDEADVSDAALESSAAEYMPDENAQNLAVEESFEEIAEPQEARPIDMDRPMQDVAQEAVASPVEQPAPSAEPPSQPSAYEHDDGLPSRPIDTGAPPPGAEPAPVAPEAPSAPPLPPQEPPPAPAAPPSYSTQPMTAGGQEHSKDPMAYTPPSDGTPPLPQEERQLSPLEIEQKRLQEEAQRLKEQQDAAQTPPLPPVQNGGDGTDQS